jgi:hypothetical protein
MPEPTEPTPEQCSSHEKVFDTDRKIGFACWYPQMGGYVGKAVVVFTKNDQEEAGCFDAFVWHDGDFPFTGEDGGSPAMIHHCGADQFIDFGRLVLSLQEQH